MFWLLDTNNVKLMYNFIQIFKLEEKEIKTDTVYKLDTNFPNDTFPIISGNDYWNIVIEKNIKPIIFEYCVKIIGTNISWTNLETLDTINFEFENKFIEPSNNKYNLPIFDFTYKSVDKTKFPELLSKAYDQYYPKIKFTIYQINTNLILVQEQNFLNNSTRKYIIARKN